MTYYTSVSVNHRVEDWPFGTPVPHSCMPTRHAQAEGCVCQRVFPPAPLWQLAEDCSGLQLPLRHLWHSLLQSLRREAGGCPAAAACFGKGALQKLLKIPTSILRNTNKCSMNWTVDLPPFMIEKIKSTLLKVIQNFIFTT